MISRFLAQYRAHYLVCRLFSGRSALPRESKNTSFLGGLHDSAAITCSGANRKWTEDEKKLLRLLVDSLRRENWGQNQIDPNGALNETDSKCESDFDGIQWTKVSEMLGTGRSPEQCRNRYTRWEIYEQLVEPISTEPSSLEKLIHRDSLGKYQSVKVSKVQKSLGTNGKKIFVRINRGKWANDEDKRLLDAIPNLTSTNISNRVGNFEKPKNEKDLCIKWSVISKCYVFTRTAHQCRRRWELITQKTRI